MTSKIQENQELPEFIKGLATKNGFLPIMLNGLLGTVLKKNKQ
jgi:hypothetical protein